MKKNIFILLLILMLLSTGMAIAQNIPDPPSPGDSGPGNVDDTPINYLIYPFLILGAYLGFKKAK